MLALLAVGTIASANAQEGSILLYGNAGIQSITDASKNNTFNWNVTPGIGYQLNQNWTVGLNLGYGQNTQKLNDSSNRNSVNSYKVGVFGRYAHAIGDSKIFTWYGQLDLGYAGQYTTDGSAAATDKASGIAADLFPALGVNVGCNWALNFSVGGISYNTLKANDAPAGIPNNTQSTFNFTLGQQVNIGLSKNFGGHKMHGHHEPGDEMRHMDTSDDSDSGDTGKKHHHKSKKDKEDKDDDE